MGRYTRSVCGRTKNVGADSGEQGRGLIAAPMSVLERRCHKFLGGLRTPAPAFHLPFFFFLIPPHLTAFSSSLFLSLFTPVRVQCCGPFDFDSLLLITDVPFWLCVCVCICVYDAKSQDFLTAMWSEQDTHTHSYKLIDKHTHRYVLVW